MYWWYVDCIFVEGPMTSCISHFNDQGLIEEGRPMFFFNETLWRMELSIFQYVKGATLVHNIYLVLDEHEI